MEHARGIVAVLFFFAWSIAAAGPGFAQTGDQRVQLIISKLPTPASKDQAEQLRVLRILDDIRGRAGAVSSQPLGMTKSEVWSIPRENVEAVKQAAARHGVVVYELGANRGELFSAASDAKLTLKQKGMMKLAKLAKATLGVRMVAGPPPAVLEHALTRDASDPSGAQISFALDDNTIVTVNRTSVEMRPGMGVWRGTVEQTGSLVTLMWWAGGKITGTVQKEGRIYAVRHVGGRIYAIVEMSEERMPQEHAAMPKRLRVKNPNLPEDSLVKQGDGSILRLLTAGMRPPSARPPQPSQQGRTPPRPAAGKEPSEQRVTKDGAPTDDVVIDVIVAFTKKAAAHYADIKRELIALAIEEANEAFRKSNLGNIKLRLVHAYQTDYVEKGTHFDHVWRFADKGDGYMEEIFALRDKHRADVAVLIVDDRNGCGLSTRVYADASDAFSVVHHECAAATYSLAHEIGHLIGARHDPTMDTSTKPFPYGHGYVNGTQWRDIMSYKETCGGCPRLPIWSGPNVIVNGTPAGTPEQDNARVIAEQAARVAGFR
jgi:Metallo-peptidase family M12